MKFFIVILLFLALSCSKNEVKKTENNISSDQDSLSLNDKDFLDDNNSSVDFDFNDDIDSDSDDDSEIINDDSDELNDTDNTASLPDEVTKELPLTFAVLSDLHIEDSYSEAIFESAVDMVIEKKCDFAFISGDLTNGGLKSQYEIVNKYLKKLYENNIPVFAISGNHDLLSGGNSSDFLTVTSTYANKQIERIDELSGSFSLKIAKNLKIIGIMSSQNGNAQGVLETDSVDWIVEEIADSKIRGEFVVAFMHQNLVNHYSLESMLLPAMMFENFEAVSKSFAEAGLRLVFSGHAHATDIALKKINDNAFFYEAETSSLSTFPSPVRFVEITKDGKAVITTESVKTIKFDTSGKSFAEFSEEKLDKMLEARAYSILKGRDFSNEEIEKSLPVLVAGMKAHVLGDENPDEETLNKIKELKNSLNKNLMTAAFAAESFFTDIKPEDNTITIELY